MIGEMRLHNFTGDRANIFFYWHGEGVFHASDSFVDISVIFSTLRPSAAKRARCTVYWNLSATNAVVSVCRRPDSRNSPAGTGITKYIVDLTVPSILIFENLYLFAEEWSKISDIKAIGRMSNWRVRPQYVSASPGHFVYNEPLQVPWTSSPRFWPNNKKSEYATRRYDIGTEKVASNRFLFYIESRQRCYSMVTTASIEGIAGNHTLNRSTYSTHIYHAFFWNLETRIL